MKIQKALILAALATAAFSSTGNAQNSVAAEDSIRASGGMLRIIPKFHASMQLEYQGKVIAIDPIMYGSWKKKADYILVTHPHGDHLSLPAIAKLMQAGTIIIAPHELLPTIKLIPSANVVSATPGKVINYSSQSSGKYGKVVAFTLKIQALAMYNLQRGPQPGKKYHPKEDKWTGYVLTLGGKRLYIAGDTEATPEMKALKNIDAAFLPMNLPYTMTPEEAAGAAKVFQPKVVYPYHFRSPFNKANDTPERFARVMRGSGVKVKLLDWYPASGIKRFLAAEKNRTALIFI